MTVKIGAEQMVNSWAVKPENKKLQAYKLYYEATRLTHSGLFSAVGAEVKKVSRQSC